MAGEHLRGPLGGCAGPGEGMEVALLWRCGGHPEVGELGGMEQLVWRELLSLLESVVMVFEMRAHVISIYGHTRSLLGVVLIRRVYWRVHGVHRISNSWHYGIGHVPLLVWSSPLPGFS